MAKKKKKKTWNYHRLQQFHFWAFASNSWKRELEDLSAPPWPQKCYSQEPQEESSQVSTDQQVDKPNGVYSSKGMLFSLQKQGTSNKCAMAWMSLEVIKLGEINQSKKNKWCLIPLTGGPSHRSSNSETKRRTVVAKGCGESQCFKERGGLHFGMRVRDGGSREEWWWMLHKMWMCLMPQNPTLKTVRTVSFTECIFCCCCCLVTESCPTLLQAKGL